MTTPTPSPLAREAAEKIKAACAFDRLDAWFASFPAGHALYQECWAHRRELTALRAAVAQAEAERDEARAESASLQATIRKLTAPVEADEYAMPARNDPEFAAKRFAFAREANERVWDALAITGNPGAGHLWDKEGKAAKAAGLYAPATYYHDVGSGLKGKLRNAGIPVAGDWNAKRASAAPASEAPDGPAPARKGDQ